MRPIFKLFRRSVAVGALLGGLFPLVVATGPAEAFTVPFHDASVNGALTMCNRNGQPVTSGSLDDVPFVWSAVSSVAAPTGYTRAYLAVFDPIQFVDPSDWSGNQLTTVAIYSNPRHPVAQATYADVPLLFTYNSYPPRWDGLYELRMYFTNPDKPPFSSSYPAAVIHVSNNRWTLVSGGGTPCNVGTAISVASLRLPKSQTETPQTLLVGPKTAGSNSNSNSNSFDNLPYESGRPASGNKVAAGVAKAGVGGGGVSPGIIAAIVIGAILVLGPAAGMVIRRRRGSAQ